MKITKFAITTAAILLSATTALAQDRKPISQSEMSNYVVSARAGVVSLVEGGASVTHARPFATPDMLISGDELLTGDSVSTGVTGRAEVLLNPGCYLRLGEGSQFVFLFDSFTSNKIKLLQGSAVIEASAIDGYVIVQTPKATFQLTSVGLYRFTVAADGKAEVAVRKGRAYFGNVTIKDGKRAVVEGSTVAIAKLSKQDVDSLDDWSKNRAKSLIAANRRLSNPRMTRTLGMSFMNNAWIYDRFSRSYTFLPSSGGFSSPYGWNYPVCNPYWAYYYSNPRYNNGEWRGGNGNGQPTSGGGSGSGSGGGTSGGGGSGGGGGGNSGGGGGGHQPAPPPVTSAPERTVGGTAGSSERERPSRP